MNIEREEEEEAREEEEEARDWIISGLYEVPERMPNVDLLYSAGATYVTVKEYNEESGRMVLNITFPYPEDAIKTTELWLQIANCDHDGVKPNMGYRPGTGPVNIKMLIMGPDEYITKQAQGPDYAGGPTAW
jgi:hypothetical protein